MALTHFRNKQKTIAWIIAIPLIATFTLFGLTNRSANNRNVDLVEVDGDVITSSEFNSFIEKQRAVNPGMRFSGGVDGIRQVGYMIYRIKVAKEIGFEVSDAEIGSFILENPAFKNPETGKFDEKTFNNRLTNYYRMNPTQYKAAVADHLMLEKFENALDSTALVSPLEAYNFWAMENAEIKYDLLTVKTSDYIAKAKEDIEDIEKAMRDYVSENSSSAEMRKPGQFNLEYLISRYDAMPIIRPSSKEIKDYYNAHKDDYKDKKFDDVKDQIEKKLITENKEQAAKRKIKTEVDTLLTAKSGDFETLSAAVVMDMLNKNKILGIESGNTGKLLTLDEIRKHSLLGSCDDLINTLESIDQEENSEHQQKLINQLMTNFNERKTSGNMSNEVGVFKIRVLDYKKGEPYDIETDAKFRAKIKDKILNKKAGELAERDIEEIRIALLDGKSEGYKFESKTEKMNQVRDLISPDINLNEPTFPAKTADGFSLKILRERKIPTYAEYSMLPTDKRTEFRRRATMFSRGFSAGRYGYIPGNRFRLWNIEAVKNNKINILVKMNEEESHEGHNH